MNEYFLSLKNKYHISDGLMDEITKAYDAVQPYWMTVNNNTATAQIKILNAFQKNQASDFHLNGSTGYGYGDTGRDILELIWADIFKAEKALVRSNIASGTHALALCLFGILLPGDTFVSISGEPYDTLQTIIGRNKEMGTLSELGIHHKVVELVNDEFDFDGIAKTVTPDTKMVCIQRSRGYNWRKSLTIAQIEEAIAFVKNINPEIIVFVDNCYGEFVELKEPLEIGADLIAGSLIKNPGGGLAPRGGYVAGKAHLVDRAAARLTAPGIAEDVGSALDFNRLAYQGLFMAPLIVEQSMKGAIFAAQLLAQLGYKVSPAADAVRTDIIQAIQLDEPDNVRKFCRGIQMASPLDAHVTPYDAELPGYDDPVIMAGGTFVQGSSIELSIDGPMREPYIVYMQGGLSVAHVIAGVVAAVGQMEQ
ncbi:MAG: methionine gamma-lyase family protein [Peptococcaceae bacterium]|jgi:cystathionine beta-lyase family protein involved in aluminum resistance|nr:methionine gamma-lyase family protein [Peptococcaceae bacterium]MBQ2119545.1 methionine gamma-lyase family protein [Peptococcaceae bacterium]